MKLVCIDSGQYWLTPGKTYDTEISTSYSAFHSTICYNIINDLGIRHAAEGFLFVELDKVRQQKLSDILSESSL